MCLVGHIWVQLTLESLKELAVDGQFAHRKKQRRDELEANCQRDSNLSVRQALELLSDNSKDGERLAQYT